MKIFFLSLIFFLAPFYLGAAVPESMGPDYVLPDDMNAVTRGSLSVCQTREGSGGKRSLSFLQSENAICPEDPHKAVGWDRPQSEPVSPGIPFQNQGIERQ